MCGSAYGSVGATVGDNKPRLEDVVCIKTGKVEGKFELSVRSRGLCQEIQSCSMVREVDGMCKLNWFGTALE